MQKKEGYKQNTWIVLILIVIISVGLYSWQSKSSAKNEKEPGTKEAQQTQLFKNVSPKEFYDLIQEHEDDENVVILDVRTPGEFKDGHIQDAKNIDYYDKTFSKQLDTLDKEKTYLIYCRSGNRSRRALSLMEKLNFSAVYNMKGGISSWHAQKFPVTKLRIVSEMTVPKLGRET